MKFMIIKTRQETKKILFKDILYIISHPNKAHHVQIVTKEDVYSCPQTLKNLEELYSEDLIRCHRRCLVNISKICSVNRQEKIILLGENGDYCVTFSRRRHQEILQKWLRK
ncbi:LytR/AlgR family response regulator transcription factor [Streptococcus cuniculipharyngis]|uniref:LytTR family transcriptional regulator n=1 Tax=Streptococcus cuniculipharyngis TaxID=1562651 RepID=A0A5C5SF81_9STRE|nr:LytTR family DNA-binding domain-containing protein [Streptococcus cuniculipharyngis]TWS98793.1 LytTR family transcriptional regulator [Streptococcus cuniculipharyngis]